MKYEMINKRFQWFKINILNVFKRLIGLFYNYNFRVRWELKDNLFGKQYYTVAESMDFGVLRAQALCPSTAVQFSHVKMGKTLPKSLSGCKK